MVFRGPEAGLALRFIETLSGKSCSLYDIPGQRPQIYIWSLETKKRSTAFSKCMCIYGKLYGLGKKTTPAWAFFAHQWANTNYISTTHELKRTEKHMVLIYPRFRTKFPVYENSPPNNLSDYKINFCVHQQIVQFDNVWLDISNLTFCRTNKYFYDPRKKTSIFT